jgi:transcriptional regulator with XRE-family HTH domain
MPQQHVLVAFANALQLSINTRIGGISAKEDTVEMRFHPNKEAGDLRLEKFSKIFGGVWQNQLKEYVINAPEKIDWAGWTLFLLLTRMEEDNILKLADADEFAADIAVRLGLKARDLSLSNLSEVASIVSSAMEKRKMTIRELAEASGLTQVSIGNFKSGKDMRLSSLLKILKALGLSLRIR